MTLVLLLPCWRGPPRPRGDAAPASSSADAAMAALRRLNRRRRLIRPRRPRTTASPSSPRSATPRRCGAPQRRRCRSTPRRCLPGSPTVNPTAKHYVFTSIVRSFPHQGRTRVHMRCVLCCAVLSSQRHPGCLLPAAAQSAGCVLLRTLFAVGEARGRCRLQGANLGVPCGTNRRIPQHPLTVACGSQAKHTGAL